MEERLLALEGTYWQLQAVTVHIMQITELISRVKALENKWEE